MRSSMLLRTDLLLISIYFYKESTHCRSRGGESDRANRDQRRTKGEASSEQGKKQNWRS